MKVGTVTIPDWVPETLATVREDLAIANVAWTEKKWWDVNDNRLQAMTEIIVPQDNFEDMRFWFEGQKDDARLVWANF